MTKNVIKRKIQHQQPSSPPPIKKPRATPIAKSNDETVLGPAFSSRTEQPRTPFKAIQGRRIAIDLEATTHTGKSSSTDLAYSELPRNTILPPNLKRTCFICCENKDEWEYPKAADVPEECRHALLFCHSCMRRTISDQISARHIDNIGCPQCSKPWDYFYIRKHATTDTFSQYENKILTRFLENDGAFGRCIAPGCISGQLHDEVSGPIVICQACKFKACFTHQVPWHTGQTCEEYQKAREEELEETRFKRAKEEAKTSKRVRPCPSCNVDILKHKGCDHMTCKACKEEFCWQCLADYRAILKHGNHHHAQTCPYWRPSYIPDQNDDDGSTDGNEDSGTSSIEGNDEDNDEDNDGSNEEATRGNHDNEGHHHDIERHHGDNGRHHHGYRRPRHVNRRY